MTRELITVYYAEWAGEAEFVVYWLAERGIPAAIRNWCAPSETASENPVIDAPGGIEVCCERCSNVARAIHLLKTELALPAEKRAMKSGEASVVSTCEACGHRGAFDACEAGSVQVCPNCGEFVDVPRKPWTG